ncbi:hypothetical protein GOODEAATRI_013899 [Goodea atripinnis]|uniref:Uncharacterized protein n=1 Tax=Goodea atripinnis TaxID=208336 RepID=A0ABV0PYE5_9TELE
MSFLDVCCCACISALVIEKDHFSHQHHQLMEVLPRLYHKVTWVASHSKLMVDAFVQLLTVTIEEVHKDHLVSFNGFYLHFELFCSKNSFL